MAERWPTEPHPDNLCHSCFSTQGAPPSPSTPSSSGLNTSCRKAPSGQLDTYLDLWYIQELLVSFQGLMGGRHAEVRALATGVQELNDEACVVS